MGLEPTAIDYVAYCPWRSSTSVDRLLVMGGTWFEVGAPTFQHAAAAWVSDRSVRKHNCSAIC